MPALVTRQPAPAVVTTKNNKRNSAANRHTDTADARTASHGSVAATAAATQEDEAADRVPAPTKSRSVTVKMPRIYDVICPRCHAHIPIFIMRKHTRNIDRIEEKQDAAEEEHKRVCAKQVQPRSNKPRPSPTVLRPTSRQTKKASGVPAAKVANAKVNVGAAKNTTPSTRSDGSKGAGRVKGSSSAPRAGLTEGDREAALRARTAAAEARRLEDSHRRAQRAAYLERLKREFPLNGDRPAGKRGREMPEDDARCISWLRNDLFKPKDGEPDAKRPRKE
ncbi:uncharacterized protein SCHCODRAFT_02684266 [Schizophyllum commune H4-8]|nr:uncharacterized protein SCHCODRAFT_02684266 [Schizophyllum commune H4-8]KAI5898004.1 hypothetical protein SCHCODRAFT_02684266 [Schizophyllum commune H4-8]